MTDSTMAISDLPQDLVEEVLCRVPLTSLNAVRATCKSWNDLSNDRRFTKKHIAKAKAETMTKKESLVIMMVDSKVYLMSLNLFGKSSVMEKGKLISLNDSNPVHTSQIFHCDGLVLCVTDSGLVVSNPYLGQTLRIEPTSDGYLRGGRYALGYGTKNNLIRSYKILRFVEKHNGRLDDGICAFELYSFKTKSWKVVHVNRDWDIEFFQHGVSMKGNSYWSAYQMVISMVQGDVVDLGEFPDFLICFDFTIEKFGPHLPLPFQSRTGDTVTLSNVGEKQLAVLCRSWGSPVGKIWITSNIEPSAVSWSPLFLVDIRKPFTWFQPHISTASFFVDDKKKVVMVLGKEKDIVNPTATRNTAYIIGQKGYLTYFKQVDLGESTQEDCFPFVCSYVPTSLRFKQAARERKVDKTGEVAIQELEGRGNEADQN